MRRYHLFGICLFFLISCHKDNASTDTNVPQILNYQIFLNSDNTIAKILYRTPSFISKIEYYYNDSVILLKFTDLLNDSTLFSISKITYILGQNGYAEYSLDTTFSYQNHDTVADSIYYRYDADGYLVESDRDGASINYSYFDGDLVSYPLGAFTYYDSLNKIDLYWIYIANGIAGKQSLHLIKHKREESATGISDISFEHKLDSLGYVTQTTETRRIYTKYNSLTKITISNFTYFQVKD